MNTLVNEKVINTLLNDNNFNTELKAMLNQMIDEELAKELDEMDCDLIEECTNMLIELEQQDDDGLAVILPLISSEKIMTACTKSGFRYFSRGLRASIIAAIILFSAFTTNTVIAKVFDYNIAQEVINTITEKLVDWGVLASAEDKNETTVDHIPYEKPDNPQGTELPTEPVQPTEKPIQTIPNKVPPVSNEKKEEEQSAPAEPVVDISVEEPADGISTFTITFQFSDDENDTLNKTVTYGKPIGELPVVTKDGYEFAGWYNVDISYYRENGRKVETPIKSTTIYNLKKDGVVTAKWNKLLTINLDSAGGSCDVESIIIGSTSDIIDLPVPERDGYLFFGWYSEKYDFTFSTTKDLYELYAQKGDLNLTAKWRRGGYASTVTFYVDDDFGICDVEEKDYIVGLPYGELPTPEPSSLGLEYDFKFRGWGGIPDDPNACEYDMVDENTIFDKYDFLVAVWYIEKAVVTFDANGGECDVKTKTVYSENCYGYLPTPTRDGYTFVGWYRDDVGEMIEDETYLHTETTYDHTLTAIWEPISVEITFSANGGVMNKGGDIGQTETYSYLRSYGTLPEASRSGYRFAGWYTDPVGGDKIDADNTVDFIDSTVYYAHWEEDENICVVTFHSNDGKDNDSVISFNKGDEIISSKAPDMSKLERLMFKFDSWYTNKYYGEEIDTNMEVTEDMEIYAHWKINPYLAVLSLDLSKTEYQVGEQIDPTTVSLVLTNSRYGMTITQTVGPEVLMESMPIYECDTSTPGTHTLNFTCVADMDFIVTIKASAEITVVEADDMKNDDAPENIID